jgi:hypothetical protein
LFIDVLKTYEGLKSTASEKALKVFLSCFKQNAEKVRLIDYIEIDWLHFNVK